MAFHYLISGARSIFRAMEINSRNDTNSYWLNTSTFEFDNEDNGIVFRGRMVPEEILSLILSNLNFESILKCRLVCKRWKHIIDFEIWRYIYERNAYKKLHVVLQNVANPFPVFYKAYKKFNINLIKNPSGEEGFMHWTVLRQGGDGWVVENPPAGANVLPEDKEFQSFSCFATSFSACVKSQVIDLCAEGIAPIILDEVKPPIYVSEMYAGRFDCACTYGLLVVLLGTDHTKLEDFEVNEKVLQWQGSDWNKVEHEFKDYPTGVRFVKFTHVGHDDQFWKGHYGSKISRACVKIML